MGIKQEQTTKLSLEDSAFLEKLIEENSRVINVTIYNSLGKEYSTLSGDVIGELYLLCCEKVDVLKTHECPKAWLIVTARFIAKSMVRKYNKEKPCTSYSGNIVLFSGDDVFEECIYSIWLKEGAKEKLLSKLTKREKEVYQKLYVEKKKPKEVAQELGVTVNLVNNVKRNFRNKIINLIKNNKI